MITGKTEDGFKYKIEDSVLKDYRVMRIASKIAKSSADQVMLIAPELPDLILGEKGVDQLINFLIKKDGYPDTEKLMNTVFWILKDASNKSNELKNS